MSRDGAVARLRSWSRRRKVLVAVGAVVALWAVLVAVQVVSAALALRSGAHDLRTARRSATVSQLLEPETTDRLEAARGSFASADRAVSGPLLAPARLIPVLGRHVRAIDHLATSGRIGTDAALDVLDGLHELEDAPHGAGADRLAMLDRLAAMADDAAEALDGIDPGSSSGLVGPLGDTVDEVRDERDAAKRASQRLRAVSSGLSDLLAGPETYLLLGANNAEMRAGSGMYLSAAPLRFEDGHARLGEVQPTADLVLDPGVVVADGDLQANWGWLDPGRDLRQQGMSADFPQSAPLAIRTWAAATAEPAPAGVVVIDVDGIRSLLRAVGPVEVDGVRYTADDVRGELLREQYQRYGDDRDARRDQLGDVAKAIFERIEDGSWELGELATQLADAAAGRHVLIWSADPELAATWSDLGVDGHLTQDSLAVNLINRGANKLDSWVDTAVSVTTSSGADGEGGRTVELRCTVRNRSTGEGNRYVVGPNVDGVDAGGYVGLLVVNLPAGATDIEVEGHDPFLQGGDGPTVVVGTELTIPAGTSQEVVIRARVPAAVDRLSIEPAARIPPTSWSVDGTEFDRDRRRTVALGG